MKSNLLIVLPALSILFFACTNGSSDQKNPDRNLSKKPIPSKTALGSESGKKISSDFESKINAIKAECSKIDLFYDWSLVGNKDVWGTTGVGKANYFYSGDQLKRINFYPSGDKSLRYYTFYFQNGKPIFAELSVEVEAGEPINTSFNLSHVADRNVSSNRFYEDRMAPIAYTLKCYFNNGDIFHEEIVHGTSTNTGTVEITKEKKRLKAELKLVMKEA